jgi:hypothetical protein
MNPCVMVKIDEAGRGIIGFRIVFKILKAKTFKLQNNKELKRRTKSMETLGGRTLEILLAFTAMRLEYHWSRHSVDYPHLQKISERRNQIEATVADLIH